MAAARDTVWSRGGPPLSERWKFALYAYRATCTHLVIRQIGFFIILVCLRLVVSCASLRDSTTYQIECTRTFAFPFTHFAWYGLLCVSCVFCIGNDFYCLKLWGKSDVLWPTSVKNRTEPNKSGKDKVTGAESIIQHAQKHASALSHSNHDLCRNLLSLQALASVNLICTFASFRYIWANTFQKTRGTMRGRDGCYNITEENVDRIVESGMEDIDI